MRNQTIIRTLIREMMNEIDRFKKEKGRDYSLKDAGIDLLDMSKKKLAPGVPRYYFNMSSDFKMSVGKGGESTNVTPMATANPNAQYNTTPIGYYVYPLDKEYLQLFIDQNLPYLQGSEWLTIIEAKSRKELLHLGNGENFYKYQNLKKQAFKKSGGVLDFEDAWEEEHGDENIWDAQDEYDESPEPEDQEQDTQGPKAKMSTTLSKSLIANGFTWVYDPGEGLIHEAEPTQAVFLTPGSFNVVERVPAKLAFETLTDNKKSYYSNIVGPAGDSPPDTTAATNSEKYRKLLDKATTTNDPRVAAQLSKHPHEEVRNSVQSDRKNKIKEISRLAKYNKFPDAKTANESFDYIVANGHVLDKKSYEEAIYDFIRWESTPHILSKIPDALANNTGQFVEGILQSVGLRNNTPQKTLDKLMSNPSPRVLAGVAGNKNTTTEMYEQLLDVHDDQIDYAIAYVAPIQPNVTDDMLRGLAKSANAKIKKQARLVLKQRGTK